MGVSPRPGRRDLLAPESRHNIHVTDEADLRGIEGWSRETLYAAVKAADDGEDGCVVLDYDRAALYLTSGADLTYHPPRAFGLADPPALEVAAGLVYDPDDGAVDPLADAVMVSPRFDILVPAFDWEDLDEDDLLPPVERYTTTPSDLPTGASS